MEYCLQHYSVFLHVKKGLHDRKFNLKVVNALVRLRLGVLCPLHQLRAFRATLVVEWRLVKRVRPDGATRTGHISPQRVPLSTVQSNDAVQASIHVVLASIPSWLPTPDNNRSDCQNPLIEFPSV